VQLAQNYRQHVEHLCARRVSKREASEASREATASTRLPTKGSRRLRRAASPSRPAGSAGCNGRGGADALAIFGRMAARATRHAAAQTQRLLHRACRCERWRALAAAAARVWRACAVASRPALIPRSAELPPALASSSAAAHRAAAPSSRCLRCLLSSAGGCAASAAPLRNPKQGRCRPSVLQRPRPAQLLQRLHRPLAQQ
jgi:hypothetical protein